MGNRSILLAVIVGVAVATAMLVAATLLGPQSPPITTEEPKCLTCVLWMHTPTAATSGAEHWYNLTLTVNGTLTLSGLFFALYLLSNGTAIIPPGMMLTVMNGSSALAAYNLSSSWGWAYGANGSLVGGDWFSVTVQNQSLSGYILSASHVGYSAANDQVAFP